MQYVKLFVYSKGTVGSIKSFHVVIYDLVGVLQYSMYCTVQVGAGGRMIVED